MASKTGEKYTKCERTTQEQMQYYIQFCSQHPELQAGKNNPKAPRNVRNLWEQLSEQLNAMRGPTRTADKWKECLTHWKHHMRCRVRKAKAHAKATGGGPPTAGMTEFEQQALQTFGAPAVDGISGVGTLGIDDSLQLPTTCDDEETQAVFSSISLDSWSAEIESSSFPVSSAALAVSFSSPVNPDPLADNSSSPATPATSENRRQKITMETVFKATMESFKTRDQMEERALAQQVQLTEAVNNMAQGLIQMSEALKILGEKLSNQ